MMGVVVHSNVGLMHATMAIFNAWCNRVPMLLLGATGPVDAASAGPGSTGYTLRRIRARSCATTRSGTISQDRYRQRSKRLLRACAIVHAAGGPVYVNLDAALQEAKLADVPPLPDVARFAPPAPVQPDPAALIRGRAAAARARRPAMLIGRASRSEHAWAARIALAERPRVVVTDPRPRRRFRPTAVAVRRPPPPPLSRSHRREPRRRRRLSSTGWISAGTLSRLGPRPGAVRK